MTSNQLKRFNSYPEFRTIIGINSVKNYLNSARLNPPVLVYPAVAQTTRQRTRFRAKFPVNDWEVHNNTLFYRPKPPGAPAGVQRIDLEVIVPQPPAVIETALQTIYEDKSQGLGLGINQFYSQVCSQYLGINRATSTAFLKKQGDYQITRTFKKVVSRPILAKCANERWAVDCVHLQRYGKVGFNHNGHHQFIFTCVDYFSKKVWAEAMTYPLNTTKTRNALQSIIRRSNTEPHMLQSDNGPADFGGDFAVFMGNNPQIEWIKTTPYHPSSNGQVERMNLELRKRVRVGIASNNRVGVANNYEWSNHLQDYVDNINSQRSSRTKFTPNELWTAGYNPPAANIVNFHLPPITDHSTNAEIQEAVRTRLVKTAHAQLNKVKVHNFAVNDIVRLKMASIDRNVARRNKDGGLEKKWNAINYTPDTYRVFRVFRPHIHDGQLPANQVNLWKPSRPTYHIRAKDARGRYTRLMITEQGRAKNYFGSEMMLVPAGTVAPKVPNYIVAGVVNQMGR